MPLTEQPAGVSDAEVEPEVVPELAVGSRVLIVRSPWFARRGLVGRLPGSLEAVESGARCLVAEVDLDGGGTARVPRCNLEVLAGP